MTEQVRRTRDEVLDSFREYRKERDRHLRNELILEHRWIAVHCASRFANRGQPLADLVQVAQIGVLKSVERFDPDMGVAFATFAVPTVLGELRRHFRDSTWSMRVPRRLKDLYLEVNDATSTLSQRLGRAPTTLDIAEELHISEIDVLEALDAGEAYRSVALHHVDPDDDWDDEPRSDAVKVNDEQLANAETRLAARAALMQLSERKREIVYLSFYQGLTQQEIGDRMGISQVHVSRLLRAALRELRDAVDDDVQDEPGHGLDEADEVPEHVQDADVGGASHGAD